MNDTLILNKSYIPIHIADWTKAISLLYRGHANALDHDFMVYNYDDWLIQTPELCNHKKIKTCHYEVAIPDVMVLTLYNKLPIKEVQFTRQSIFQRDNYICQYCGKKFKKDELEKEHVFPKSRGGKNTWDNIVSACSPCNARKANRTPQEAGMKLIRKPSPPVWLNPFNKLKHHPNKKKQWMIFLKKVDGK